ncbi:MAG: NosD domain-containing protein [Candidatus Thorarchaeota archaeon]
MNGKPLGYYWNVSDLAIDGTLLGQVFVVNSTRITVSGGSFHDCPIAVNLAYCTDCEVSDAVVAYSGMHGLAVMQSQNCTVFNCTIYDSSNSGIMCSSSPNCTLNANTAYDNNVGITVDSSPSTTVSNSTIYDQGYVGIECWGMHNGTIWNNTVWGSYGGISISWGQNCTVSNNTVVDNWYHGFSLDDCSFCEATYNGAFASDYYGIVLGSDSHNNTFFGNEFAANDQYNALDDGYDNTWDDGVSMGNGWGDYIGPGVYNIPGAAGSVDNYPWLFVDIVPPTIDHPDDIELELGGIGRFITWHPMDVFPDRYDLYADEVVVESDIWEGDPIMIWVNPSKVGILNYTLVVFDQGGLSTGDTVLVNVSTAPGALLITSNSDFVTQSWPGSGTEIDPYIIEGLDITLNATTAYIGDVDAHFVIRGCSFSSHVEHFGDGIIFNNVTNGQIESCIIMRKTAGIYVTNSDNCTIWNNTIYDNYDAGIYAAGTTNLTISENEAYNSTRCVEILNSGSIAVYNNTIYEGHDSGVYVESSPGTVVSLNTIYHVGSTMMGPSPSTVMFMMSPGCTASNNTLHSSFMGIASVMSPECIIANNTINDILMGTYIYVSGSCVVTDNTLSNSGFLIYGMTPADSYMIVSGNTVNGKPFGYVWNSTGEVIDGNLYGQVLVANSTGVTVNGGNFSNCTAGVALEFCQDCHITNVDSMNSYLGLVVLSSNDTSVTNCVLNGSYLGAVIQMAWNCTVDFNEIHGNQMMGVQLSESYNCTITRNWIYENGAPGIALDGSNNTLYGNKIGWNGGPMYGDYNAMDHGSSNTWDDGVSAGNAWHDYSGTGMYSIYGMAGSVDRYPSLLTDVWAAAIDSPVDQEYDEGATGNSITWTPSHPRPDHYELYRNDSLLGSWVWDGSPILVDVDGFSVGVYNYTVMVYNERGYNSTDTVFVTVVDGTPPTIDSPSDINYELGVTGNSITWTPSDLHPDHYELYQNDSLLGSWVWDGSPIVIDVDGLGGGTYNYTLTAYDIGDNTISDTVFVSVVDTTAPTIDSPSDINYELGVTGNSITWTPSDLGPDHYELYRNDSLLGSWVWDGSPIVVDVDGLGVDTYNYTLVAYDIGDNTASDTVFVSVEDTTPPDWVVSPSDQSIDYGQALEYQLQATDLSGIGAWHINDTVNFVISGTGYLENNTILEAGDYGLNISVEDIYGNTRSFTIRLRILPVTNTTTTTTTTTTTEEVPPLDPMILVIVIGIGAVVIVIIIIVAIKRKR